MDIFSSLPSRSIVPQKSFTSCTVFVLVDSLKFVGNFVELVALVVERFGMICATLKFILHRVNSVLVGYMKNLRQQ